LGNVNKLFNVKTIDKLLVLGALIALSPFALKEVFAQDPVEYSDRDRLSVRPRVGFVSKPETAVAIAQAVLKGVDPDYDSKKFPMMASKRDGYWLVMTPPPAETALGGGTEIEIEEHSGTILRYWRSR
jgi:hypothetical protein